MRFAARPNMSTQEDYRRFVANSKGNTREAYVDRTLVEHFEGYLVIGFIAGTHEHFEMCRHGGDTRTILALREAAKSFLERTGGQNVDT
jgi:hypothetical protein